MPSLVTQAVACCNGEVGYLCWTVAEKIDGCLGFMVTRVHETGPDAGLRRILPTWIAFTDQSNPNWQNQDSSVWPIQSCEWRDLTLRKSHDTTTVRPINFKVHYEIVPVGTAAAGRRPVPASDTAVYRDPAGQPRYDGPPRPLFEIGAPFVTGSVEVTHEYAGIAATFNNGILSTQNLLQQLRSAHPQKPGDDPDSTKGLKAELIGEINDVTSAIRAFLAGDVIAFVRQLLDRAAQEGGTVFLALYELDDPELVGLLKAGVSNGTVHMILSTAGSTKGGPGRSGSVVWDTTNDAARRALEAIAPAAVQDRMFNNSAHIGHDKFAVYVKNGPKAVMTGSTNWTATGLCAQSNNAIIVEDAGVAAFYLDFWHRLAADPQPPRVPLTVGTVSGAAPSAGKQGPALRSSNMAAFGPVAVTGGAGQASVWFSPNTRAPTKTAASPIPGDLAQVYDLMDKAKGAILFLSFMPGEAGRQNVIGEARKLAEARPDLLVMGAVSDPRALPDYKRPAKGTAPPSVWWPDGDQSRIAFIRATEIRTPIGDLKPELLGVGYAIIHDKIIVIDPLDASDCVVITGSHNLGFKASYGNDENLLIIRGNRDLAIAYAVHVIDIYDHYVTRAKLAASPAPAPANHGLLSTDDSWQDPRIAVTPGSCRAYFLGAGASVGPASPRGAPDIAAAPAARAKPKSARRRTGG